MLLEIPKVGVFSCVVHLSDQLDNSIESGGGPDEGTALAARTNALLDRSEMVFQYHHGHFTTVLRVIKNVAVCIWVLLVNQLVLVI